MAHPTVSHDDKDALNDLNNRFLNYVNRVRQLKDEDDIRVINQSINLLEEELRSLKTSYEFQISQLKGTLELLMTQKTELERELMARKNSECHMNDRLAVESSKNGKLLHELGCLRSDLSSRDQDIISLNLALKQFRLESTDAADGVVKQQRQLHEYREKIEKYETQLRDKDNQIFTLNQKVEFQDQFFNKVSQLQGQLDTEIADNKDLRHRAEELNSEVMNARKREIDITSKMEQLNRQNGLLEESLSNDRAEAAATMNSLEEKVRQLQERLVSQLDQGQHGQSSSVTVRAEIDFLRRLLTEEEHRLNIKRGQVAGTQFVEGDMMGDDERVEASEEESGTRMNDTVLRVLNDEEAIGEQLEEGQDEYEEENDRDLEESHREIHISETRPVGPIMSAPSSQRPCRPASANARGLRTQMSPSCHVPERAGTAVNMGSGCGPQPQLRGRTDSGIGQSPDYMDSVFRLDGPSAAHSSSLHKQPQHEEDGGGNDGTRVSLTNLKVLNVGKDGKCVKIWNSNETEDAELGGYSLRQLRHGHPLSLYRFPGRVRVPAGCTVTVWAGATDPLLHQPPTDFYSVEPSLWGATPDYTTVLVGPGGGALSWAVSSHRLHVGADLNIRPPAEPARRLPEISGGSGDKASPPYIVRELSQTRSMGAVHHPFTSTPKAGSRSASCIHPCLEPSTRGSTLANDNSSFNRQTRHQLACLEDGSRPPPDHLMAYPYAGTNEQRMMGTARVIKHHAPVLQKSHCHGNRVPEVFLCSNTEPPNAFQKPMSRFSAGLEQIQNQHNIHYSGPMYRVDRVPSSYAG